MARLTITGLKKSFGKTPAVRGIDLDIPEGEFTVLVGPSDGCRTTISTCRSNTTHV